MIRVFEHKVDGIDAPFKIASMSSREAEEFITTSKAMVARSETSNVAPDEWMKFRLGIVCRSLNHADGDCKLTVDDMLDFDNPTLDALYVKVLEFSGLKVGGAAAVSVLPRSAAA